MFDWLKNLNPFRRAPEQSATQIALDTEGYSPGYINGRVREVRGKLIEFREHLQVIKENGADQDGKLGHLMERMCAAVEKVLQNLKRDPKDMARMGLALETLDPLKDLVERCAQFAATGVESSKLNKALEAAKQALTLTADKFQTLHSGALQLDDEIELKGLKKAIERLNG